MEHLDTEGLLRQQACIFAWRVSGDGGRGLGAR